jgi:catechol 2,3-dioxygenase-like lactoylglutathione lyase family enzyme
MTIRALDHVNIRAHRAVLDELKTFYCDVLGLRAGPRPPFPRFGYWLHAGERAVVHLYESEPGEARATHDDHTLDHFAFACDDLAGVVATLERHGLAYRKASLPGRDVVQIFVRDPAGHSVELDFAAEAA